MLCGPAGSVEVAKLAMPPLRVPEPRMLLPSWKSIVPVALGGETVAIRVTDCPALEGFELGFTAVAVECLTMVCESTLLALPKKFVSPL